MRLVLMKKITQKSIDTAKNITIGFLLGTVLVLWLTALSYYIEKEAAEEMLEPIKIKLETPKEYKGAIKIPTLPSSPLTKEELLTLASMFPEVFTDEEIITLLTH
jgi:hypothetical protein|tara:strand:+ start:183 stop:497 length:315 start_codon:yes stop_codon:yes gene_type:complete